MTKSCIIISLIGALTAFAGDDPGGWTAAKWGMTDQQILAALPGQAVQLEKPKKFTGGNASVSVPEFQVGPDRARIFFIGGQDGLHEVHFSFDPDREAFARLEAALVQRYGKPWSHTTAMVQQSQWTLRTTVITLRFVTIRQINEQSLYLTYEKRTEPPL